jgi:hypothetical protein
MTDVLGGESPFDGALPPRDGLPPVLEPGHLEPDRLEPAFVPPAFLTPVYAAPELLEPELLEPAYLPPASVEPAYAEPPYVAPPLEALPPLEEPPARRSYTAERATRIAVLAFAVLSLTNSAAFVRAGEGMEDGWIKTVTLGVARPVDDVASFLRLDRPRARVDAMLGREVEDSEPVVDPAPVTPPASGSTASAAPPTPDQPTQAPEPPPSVAFRDASAATPLRLLITGDSMIEFWGSKLVNASDDKGAVKAKVDVRYGTGLVRPDFFDWQAHAPKVIAEQDPEAVMIMMGGNDGQNIRLPSGQILQAGSDEWQAEYQRRAASLMAALSSDGRRVYWVGMPIPKSSKLRGRFESANAAAEAAAGANPAVRFVDTWDLFAKNGAYADYLPDASGKQVLVRARDGIHLSRDGAAKLTAHLLPILDGEWKLLD